VKLPNAAQAVVDLIKLRDYCLSSTHPRGRHKARVFADALGINAGDAEYLRDVLLRAALMEDAMRTDQDEYGQRYQLDVVVTRSGKTVIVRSAWIVLRHEDVPRLTTCYVL